MFALDGIFQLQRFLPSVSTACGIGSALCMPEKQRYLVASNICVAESLRSGGALS